MQPQMVTRSWDLVYPPRSLIPAQGNGRRMQALRRELHAAWDGIIDEAAESGTYTLGDAVRQFERLIEDAWAPPGSELHAVLVNSGTTALHGALVACGIKPGDAVIVPAMTFISTALACSWVGATPIFVDITPGTWTLNVEAVRALLAENKALRRAIKAIIPVHLYGGIMPDMTALLDLAALDERWKVIEDASQAHGATLVVDGETWHAGTMSDVGCLSMSGVKNAGVVEDGGCLLTHSPERAESLRVWRDLGRKPRDRYGFHVPGVRGRMGKLAAASGMVQFRHLDEWNVRRREIAARYTAAIQEAGLPLSTPAEPEGSTSAYYKYIVVAKTPAERERLEDSLEKANIETEHYYPRIVPEQPIYQTRQLPHMVAGDLVVSRHLAACGTCLPIYPELLPEEQERVIAVVKRAFSRQHYAGVELAEAPESVAAES